MSTTTPALFEVVCHAARIIPQPVAPSMLRIAHQGSGAARHRHHAPCPAYAAADHFRAVLVGRDLLAVDRGDDLRGGRRLPGPGRAHLELMHVDLDGAVPGDALPV